MMSDDWEYYGRDALGSIYELYRAPAEKLPPETKFAKMERLKKSLVWESAAKETALRNEWLSGWFDFDDNRLTGEQVNALVKQWADAGHWPGRD